MFQLHVTLIPYVGYCPDLQFFLRQELTTAPAHIGKHLNNSFLHNITPGMFHAYIFAEQPIPPKVIRLHLYLFIRIHCSSKISTYSIANRPTCPEIVI